MGQHTSRTDFEWRYTDQPHTSRRELMLKKYPQIKKLFGVDPNFKWACSAVVIINIAAAIVLQNASWPVFLFFAFFFAGTCQHALMLAEHEISHNVVFGNGRPLANRLFGIWANLPLLFPVSVGFKKYHVDHHRYLSTDLDVDIPTHAEAKFFNNTAMKFLWLIVQPVLYGMRPPLVKPKPLEKLEYLNIAICIAFISLMWGLFGPWTVGFLFIAGALGTGVHPSSGHFISEHYMFYKGYETYSYYGSMNALTWNVGYHVEHHDFPFIPGSRLPLLTEIAPEFYRNIPCHTSWIRVLWDFVMDPEMGPYARIKHPVGCKVAPDNLPGTGQEEATAAMAHIWRLDDWQVAPEKGSLPAGMTTRGQWRPQEAASDPTMGSQDVSDSTEDSGLEDGCEEENDKSDVDVRDRIYQNFHRLPVKQTHV